jgi:hypothetical protein
MWPPKVKPLGHIPQKIATGGALALWLPHFTVIHLMAHDVLPGEETCRGQSPQNYG